MSKKHLIFLIKTILFAAVIWLVGKALWGNLQKLNWDTLHVAWLWVYASGLWIIAVTFTQITSNRLLLAAYGQTITWRQSCTVAWVPALGKYVPGKVAAILGAMYLLARYRVESAVALSVALLTDALAVLSGLVVGSIALQSPLIREKLPGNWIWSALIIGAGLVCLYPPVFLKIVSFGLKKLKRPPLRATPSIPRFILPLLMAFSQWICWGLSLWCMAKALGASVTPQQIPSFISLIALANTIGYLAFFTAGGFGVREGVLLIGLSPYLSPEHTTVTVIALRIVQTMVDLILAGVGALLITPAQEPMIEIPSKTE